MFKNNGEKKNHPDNNYSRSYFGEAMFDSIYLNNELGQKQIVYAI